MLSILFSIAFNRTHSNHEHDKIGHVAAMVLASDQNIGVTNAEGAVIGVVTRQAMIAALFPESRS